MNAVSNAEFATGLLALADYYAAHATCPQLSMPSSAYVGTGEEAKHCLQAIARSVPTTIKEYSDEGLFYLIVDFGGNVIVKFFTGRQSVCEKKVVGTRIIPAKHVDAHDEEAREEQIVEWICAPLLEGDTHR